MSQTLYNSQIALNNLNRNSPFVNLKEDIFDTISSVQILPLLIINQQINCRLIIFFCLNLYLLNLLKLTMEEANPRESSQLLQDAAENDGRGVSLSIRNIQLSKRTRDILRKAHPFTHSLLLRRESLFESLLGFGYFEPSKNLKRALKKIAPSKAVSDHSKKIRKLKPKRKSLPRRLSKLAELQPDRKGNPDRNSSKACSIFWRDLLKNYPEIPQILDDIRYLSVHLNVCFDIFSTSFPRNVFLDLLQVYRDWLQMMIEFYKSFVPQNDKVTQCYINAFERALKACHQYEAGNKYEAIKTFANVGKQKYYYEERLRKYLIWKKVLESIEDIPEMQELRELSLNQLASLVSIENVQLETTSTMETEPEMKQVQSPICQTVNSSYDDEFFDSMGFCTKAADSWILFNN